MFQTIKLVVSLLKTSSAQTGHFSSKDGITENKYCDIVYPSVPIIVNMALITQQCALCYPYRRHPQAMTRRLEGRYCQTSDCKPHKDCGDTNRLRRHNCSCGKKGG
jgi:hypothetical protein